MYVASPTWVFNRYTPAVDHRGNSTTAAAMKPHSQALTPIVAAAKGNIDMDDENQNQIDDHEEATAGMNEVDNFDFERAVMLMNVMEKVATVGVKATAISGLASAALNEMNEEAKAIAKRRAEAYKELERKRDEALAAQQREREEQAAADAEEAQHVNVHPQPPMARAIPRNSAPAPTDAPNGRRL